METKGLFSDILGIDTKPIIENEDGSVSTERPRGLFSDLVEDREERPRGLFSDIIKAGGKKEYKPLIEFIEDPKTPGGALALSVQEAGAAGGKFLNALGFGIPEYALKQFAGYEIPQPPSIAGKILSGGGEFFGFAGGPLKIAGKIGSKLPLLKRAFTPATTLTQAIIKPISRGAITLGVASGIQAPKETDEGFIALPTRAEEASRAALMGAALGGLSFIPNKATRMLMSSAYYGVPATMREEPLEQQIFSYGLGAYIGRKGGSPKEVLRKEKGLADLMRFGVEDSEKFLNDNQSIISAEKAHAKGVGRDPIPRKDMFEEWTRGRVRHYEPITKNWKVNTARYIRNRIIELNKDPNFALETGDMANTTNYLSKDLGLRIKDIAKLDNATLFNLMQNLKGYTPPKESPFIQTPPLKGIFAGRDWGKKINPWDSIFKPGLQKMQKMGFGKAFPQTKQEEGLTSMFAYSAAEKAEMSQRYIGLRNNWMRVTGNNKERAHDIFQYLDGKIHANYIKSTHGEKTLKAANQMREHLDVLLETQNRHRAMYGEEPIKPRKDYITHIFEDTVKEVINKKYPFPDWLREALPYIMPQKKTSPFLKSRKGVQGYQTNIWKALDAYTNKAIQVSNDSPIRRAYQVDMYLKKQIDIEKGTAEKPGKTSEIDYSGIRNNLGSYVRDLQGQPGKLDETLRSLVDPLNAVLARLPNGPQIKSLSDMTDGMVSLIYNTQMGFRPKLPLRNLGQHSLVIGQTGFKPLGWAIKNRNSPEAREILTHSKLLKTRKQYFGAETQALDKIGRAGMKAFQWADTVNVEDAFLSGYRQAKTNPKKWPNPYARGDEVAFLTQYGYIAENRSDLARGFGVSKALGRPLSLFTTWPANWVEFQLASASDENTRANLMKYWASALAISAVSAVFGIKGSEYTGITSPLSLLSFLSGELPIMGIAQNPRVQSLRELKKFIEEGDLKDYLSYTFRE